ncbi:MAG: GNAT family N-acetyltransferase [Cytophagales bacterium]|nr:GNAT family N-acetyltransferase [Cytophagales bacterium]
MIKKVTLENLEDLMPLFHQYMEFYERPIDDKEFRAFLIERLSNDEANIFLSYEGEQANGFVVIYESFSSFSLGRIFVLNDLFVHKSARNKGIGTKLIQQTFDLAKEKNAKRVDISTALTNTKAQNLYQHMGFVMNNDFCYLNLSI